MKLPNNSSTMKFIINKIKNILNISFFSMGIIIASSCSKSDTPKIEEENKEYQINTTGFSDLSSKEVKFTGEINVEGNEPILDHGFIIQQTDINGNNSSEVNINLGKNAKLGEIVTTYKPNKSFEQNSTYSYYFYVRTSKNFIKGNIQEFALNNISVIPNEHRYSYGRDTVKINGNFEGLEDKYKIRVRGSFELFSLPFTISPDKKSISFIVGAGPEVKNNDEIQISLVRKDENPRSYVQDLIKITYLAKVILEKSNYDYLDYLNFKVENLSDSYYNIPNLYILVNGKKFPYSKNFRIFDHPELIGPSYKMGYMNGRDSTYFAEPFVFEQPSSNLSVIPFIDRIHPNTYFKYKAFDLDRYFWADVSAKIGDSEATAEYDYRDGILGIQAGDLQDGEYELTVFNPFYTFKPKEKIKVETLNITTKGPFSTYIGDTITLKGNFIKGLEYSVVNQNNYHMNMVIAEEGSLSLETNLSFEGATEFKLVNGGKYFDQITPFAKAIPYKSLGLTLDSFYPTSGTTGDVLTVEGKGIGLVGDILLGDALVQTIKINNNKVSLSIPRLKGKGKMKIGFSFNAKLYQSDGYFEYL